MMLGHLGTNTKGDSLITAGSSQHLGNLPKMRYCLVTPSNPPQRQLADVTADGECPMPLHRDTAGGDGPVPAQVHQAERFALVGAAVFVVGFGVAARTGQGAVL